jgi:hypothetical protein
MEEARFATEREVEELYHELSHQHAQLKKVEHCSMCLIKRALVLDVEEDWL